MRTRVLHRWCLWMTCTLGLTIGAPSLAQYTSDIDIYSGTASSGAANVLIVMDNTANWNTQFSAERAALRTTIEKLPVDKFRIGLMMFTETGGGNNNVDGAYVRAAVRTLDAGYKTKFLALLDSIDVIADKSNGGKASIAMAEAYYYFTGAAPNSGNSKVKTDYTGNASGSAASQAIYQLAGNALDSKSGSLYRSPVTPGGCDKNYIIYVSNNAAQDNNNDATNADNRLDAAYRAAGLTRPSPRVIPLTPNKSQGNVSDEWARFMKESPSAITTYTLDVDRVANGQGPGWSAVLGSMALTSGGKYYPVSSTGTDLELAFGEIFNKIQAVDSVFSSASLPISTSARGTYLNQVFMGMFRPDGDAKPRWRGNLKQYQFRYNVATDTLELADSSNNAAVTSSTGFVAPDAVSYWTQASTFWVNQQMGTPLSGSDSPDGYVVEKGGAAQMIRQANATSQSSRKVLTCVGASCAANGALTNFSTANSSSFAAISSDTAERNRIINWVLGTDNAGDESGPGGTTTVRPSVHGDVLHSRPAVVNYGNGTIVVFYGSNDGGLHAINGNKTGTGAGQELWSFVPEEHFPKLKRLRDNSPPIRISTTPATLTDAMLRDYFVDGPVSIYQKLNSDQTTARAILYVGMRRGGRFFYAIDVTDPANPLFLWRKSNATNDSSGDFTKLGQTWSEPRVTKLKDHTNPVLIMGGGYDAAAEDASSPGTTTMGNTVMVIDAITGELLKQFNTDRSVAADVTVISSDNQGYTDRAYAVDVGGNIYRIDFQKSTSTGGISAAVADWGIYKLAALQGTGDVRKFFYAPVAMPTTNFVAVQVGSGDREKPLKTTGEDAFFTVFDERMTKGTPATAPATITMGTGMGRVGTAQDMTHGCYISLAAGEKVVNAATAFMGSTYFGTNMPTSSSTGLTCKANLGDAKVYEAPMFCQSPVATPYVGGGLPPSPVSGVVEVSYVQTNPDGTTTTVTKHKAILIGGPNSKGSAIENTDKNKAVSLPRQRRYWYREKSR